MLNHLNRMSARTAQSLIKALLCVCIAAFTALISVEIIADDHTELVESYESLLRINSSDVETSVYKSATALAGLFNWRFLAENEYPGENHPMAVPLSSPGTVTSIGDLLNGRSELAIVRADIADLAYENPTSLDLTGNAQNLRVVATHRPVVLHIVVREEFTGTSITELRGKKVGVGPASAATLHGLEDLLAMHGIPISEFTPAYTMIGESLTRLRHGRLDALLYFDQAPSNAIADAIAKGEFKLLTLSPTLIQQYCENDETTYVQRVTSSDFYSNSENVTSIAIGSYLLTQRHITTASIEAVLDTLSATSAMPPPAGDAPTTRYSRLFTPFIVSNKLSPIPLHNGAKLLSDIFGDLPVSHESSEQLELNSVESQAGVSQ